MISLYFESSDEDDLRKTGFSKDGKSQIPQIFLGLLVGLGAYAIGNDIFEGNIYEGHTLIPIIEKISRKFYLAKPIIVADPGLFSLENIATLGQHHYQYILGARIKSETKNVQQRIIEAKMGEGQTMVIKKAVGIRLIVAYS